MKFTSGEKDIIIKSATTKLQKKLSDWLKTDPTFTDSIEVVYRVGIDFKESLNRQS